MKILAALLAGLPFIPQAIACAGLHVEDARILEAPPGAGALAGYALLRNTGETAVFLTGADSPDFTQVEFHALTQDGTVMHMRQMRELPIPAHGELRFAPGKIHIMLFGPKREYHTGDSATVKLRCGKDSLSAEFPVKPP